MVRIMILRSYVQWNSFAIAQRRVRIAVCICLVASAAFAAESSKEQSWTPLFNGRNLDGWYKYLDRIGKNSDPNHVFQIEDGAIHVYKDQTADKAATKGYFATDANYSYYHLRFQYKWGTKKFPPRTETKRDAGLIYHVTGPDVVWPRCLECQVQEGDVGDCFLVHGAQVEASILPNPVVKDQYQCRPANEGGVEKTVSSLRTTRLIKEGMFEVDGWNTVEVIVHGDEETMHIVNGHPVFHAKKLARLGADNNSWEPLPAGHIAFQAEYAEVYYRNIEIQPITGGPLHPAASEKETSAKAAISALPTTANSPVAHLPIVPEGFEISLAAAPPLVEYPTLACFDDQGRLYVSEGANINDPYDVLAKTLPRSIRRLEDTDGDGVFDRSTVFADKMTFPYGGVWHDGALYVASDPTLWRLEDTDGDGVADMREVVITGFESGGHASCMKGGFLGPDGWIYFCGGNEGAGYDLKDRSGTRLHEPHAAPCVFRIRPDGTGLEFFANGAAGVYDLTFDPSGDLFGVVTILHYPRGDGLMHWVYGAYQSSCPRSSFARLTGDLLPALHEWPQSSPSGAVLYQSGAFGKEYRGNIFAAHFGTHVVTRNVIHREGATWRMDQEDNFVQSDNLNFRFTDVLEDADGSLLVVNTGGWFRIGCPTSEVDEGDLRGAIYRVRKKDQHQLADPRGLKIGWKQLTDAELAKLLGDQRFVVRERATAEFALRGPASVPALRSALHSESSELRLNAVWALTRIDHAEARAAVRESLSDPELTNMLAALHSVGIWRDQAAFDRLVELLKSNEPAIRREAATSLGRLGNSACVPALLEPLATTSDRYLEQALIFAMIEIDAREPVLAGLHGSNPKIQRGTLIALDQMSHGALTEVDVAPLLRSEDLPLQKAALDVVARHAGWTKGVAEFLNERLTGPALSPEQGELVSAALHSAIGDRSVQQLVGAMLENANSPTDSQLLLLEAIGRSRLKKLPSAWRKPLEECLLAHDEAISHQAVDTVALFARGNFTEQLASLGLDANRPMPVRIAAAVAAVTANPSPPDDRVLEFLLSRCASQDTEVVSRLSIAQALGSARLTPAQLKRMTETVKVVGPLELPSLLKAYEDSAEPAAGAELFAALEQSPGLGSLSAGRVQRLIDRYPKPLRASAAGVLKQFGAATESQAARMKELEFALSGGDATRGHDLFMGKAACSQCHRVNKQGANIGPDLSRIGEIRTRRDFLESIAFPSATFARGYEPVTVIVSGRTYTGILRGESAKEVVLMTLGRSETTLPRDEIEEILPCSVSIMPQGLDRNLTADELQDLVAFLSSLKTNKGT